MTTDVIRYALVTGGAKRLGSAMATHLAQQGIHIALHYHRSQHDAEKTASRCRECGVECKLFEADLACSATTESMMTQVTAWCGSLDLMICNAAVFESDCIKTMQAETMQHQLQVNFVAPMLCTKYFALQKKPGKIIHVLDQRITQLDRANVSYAVSKKLLAEMVEFSALELAPNITVNGIAPGPLLAPPRTNDGAVREYAGSIPLKKRPQVEQLIMALDYLTKNDAVTGQILYVDGGQHCERG